MPGASYRHDQLSTQSVCVHALVDDLYLYDIVVGCAHEQKAHGVQLIGMDNKKIQLAGLTIK